MTSFGPLTAQLEQHAEYGRLVDGVFVVSHVHRSTVSAGNRSRIIAREQPRGGTWVDGWYTFATHRLPDLAEYRTRIRWTPTTTRFGENTSGEEKLWRDAYLIAWIGACNPNSVAKALAAHERDHGADHPAVRAIRGHLEFLRGNSLGPSDEDLEAVRLQWQAHS
jgi:hypothetical protein